MKAIYSMGQICRIWQKEAKNGKKQQQQKKDKTFLEIKWFPFFCLFNQVTLNY
jgi:hypothetical protein